ncbi:MAG: 50S ribosomal protein L13 [uncultured bacterium]|nr:MAG: 50S ribosomal protein L13 [uncultured bacterium]OGT55799.1 MAG: 50S ribosomal protein L13 [Gammaproteobacteria bacterium RIFCSPHIGHO2_12_FULL_42_10]
MKTRSFSSESSDCNKKWYVVDASQQVLGRFASQVAKYLRGKNKPTFTPHADTGDYIIIINAKDIAITGKKRKEKRYYHHSGHPGGIKDVVFEKLHAKDPTAALRIAIKGMLPKNILGRSLLKKKLKIYPGSEHPHVAQEPTLINLDKHCE